MEAAAHINDVVHVSKIATTLRELATSEDELTFLLGNDLSARHAAESAGQESGTERMDATTPSSSAGTVPATANGMPERRQRNRFTSWVRAAACTSHDFPELGSCAIKAIANRELAENEWYHLVTYRSPVFPAPFVYGTVAGADDTRVIVMELVEGPTLQEVIDEGFGANHEPAPVEKALEIMSPLAESFKMLSQTFQSFVHRDIKPANIVLSHGKCKTRLIDLGISAHEQDRLQHLHAGATHGYAPPEIDDPQRYPVDASALSDPRIDTYSLAATMYALFVGRPPSTFGASLPVGVLRHDDAVVREARAQARSNIASKHRRAVDDATLDRLVGESFARIDADLAATVTRGLSIRQEDRPTPAEFFDALPSKYLSLVVDEVQRLYLHELASSTAPASGSAATVRTVKMSPEHATDLAGTALSEDYRYDGFLDDFHRAMDCWNSGRYREAVPLLERLDEAGDPTAQYDLGICYRDGLGGIKPDEALMLAYWTKAAEAGNIVAAYNVGVCHEKGYGIPVTPEAALMWYRRSADGGFPLAEKRMAAIGAEEGDVLVAAVAEEQAASAAAAPRNDGAEAGATLISGTASRRG